MEYIDNSFEAVIGLEVHTQLLTKTKMFCSCPNVFGREPNSLVCPVCLALPGSLPVINFNAVKLAVKAALAINLHINQRSLFARKNYFYPDLPKGYQISQFQDPISSNGYLMIDIGGGMEKKIRINRLHIEEDAGKLIHTGFNSFVDLNRAGTPLAEIVSEPDLSSPAEAVAYLKDLRDIIVYLDISDGNMEEGSFRCDANVSVRKKGDTKLGTRTEVKNVNSFKFVEKALEYEINRQIELIRGGGKVIQETLLFNSKTGKTESMRGKEEAHDYRYFEEPDLPPLILTDGFIQEIKDSIGELPKAKRQRYINDYALSEYDAEVLTQYKDVANDFDELVEINNGKIDIKKIANWIINEWMLELKKRWSTDNNERVQERAAQHDENSIPIEKIINEDLINFKMEEIIKDRKYFFDMIMQVEDGKINRNGGRLVLYKLVENGKNGKVQTVEEIVAGLGLAQISDDKGIEDIIKQVLEENPKELSDYLGGKEKLFGFFVGAVMKKAKGKANPQKVNEILKKQLEKL
ncbi:MAG: Asp-tRNA(Asn)/Glu-tRNA(Gln) amidotransferase subunit GatB [Candidatus Acididesulfobacter guangdongensis]|uniref:Aspartyl/glutamyl-tRNA(Asn/Gln) amidotransferase subunit B n=1 Tax=Acididesulfobacter guangdongensis TaxID=2597225 RepID=A0A519BGN7_ACIG2|nr:MAG: Asp-tRNA(Asn)/Glu-tRNA(Gln) amidotransferase subunit GatB [Candidatus Acididesulfobacter guangdongensis]